MGHVGVAVIAARRVRIPEQVKVVVRDELRVGLRGQASGAAEVVGVGVRDDDGVHVGHLEPRVLEPFLHRFPRGRAGHAHVDDGEAAVVEQAVHVHMAKPGHGDGQLHLQYARAHVDDVFARGGLLALCIGLRHHRRRYLTGRSS